MVDDDDDESSFNVCTIYSGKPICLLRKKNKGTCPFMAIGPWLVGCSVGISYLGVF